MYTDYIQSYIKLYVASYTMYSSWSHFTELVSNMLVYLYLVYIYMIETTGNKVW